MEIEIQKCKRMIKHGIFSAFFVFAYLSFQQLFLYLQLKTKIHINIWVVFLEQSS